MKEETEEKCRYDGTGKMRDVTDGRRRTKKQPPPPT